MAIHSVVLEQGFGANKEGDVIQCDEALAASLVESGIAREATEEDLVSDDVAEEVVEEAAEGEDEEVAEEVASFRRNAEAEATKKADAEVKKAVAASVAKRPNLSIRVKDHTPDPTGGFNSLGSFVQCAQAKQRGDYSASRKLDVHNKSMQNLMRTKTSGPMSISGGSGHLGGDLVPQEWAKQLWKLSFDHVPDLHGMCTNFPMQNQVLNIPSWVQSAASAGIIAQVTAEANQIVDTAGVTATVQLSLVKYTAAVKVTDELQRFNSYALEAVLKQVVPQRIRYLSNDGVINGTNSQVNLIGNAATVTVTRATNARIEFMDVLKMNAALFDDFTGDAVWLTNQSTTPEIYSIGYPTRAATTSIPAFTPGGFTDMLGAKPMGQLLGRPIYTVENCPALGSKGDLILVSFSPIAAGTTGLIADATPFLFFDYAETYYRFMWYADTVNQLTTYYTRADGSRASNIVVLSASS